MVYFLGFAVVVVWGLIIYRVCISVGGGDDIAVASPKVKHEPYNDFAIKKDTTHLLLNYHDPFGLIKEKDTVTAPIGAVRHKNSAVTALLPAINWGLIKYSGYIKNPMSKKLLTLLNINGHSITLAEGESAENVKLIKNLRDSVKVRFNGKIKCIPLTPRTI